VQDVVQQKEVYLRKKLMNVLKNTLIMY